MKAAIWRNGDLQEPFEDLPEDATVVATEDGYVYVDDTSNDPIERFDPADFEAHWVSGAREVREL